MHRRHVIFTKVCAFFHQDFKYVLIFTVALLFKVLEGFFDRYGRNHENFLLRKLSLYMSFDSEFNAYSEYVYGFEDYFILKGLLVLKHYLGTFLGFLSFYGRTKQVKVKMKTDSESA